AEANCTRSPLRRRRAAPRCSAPRSRPPPVRESCARSSIRKIRSIRAPRTSICGGSSGSAPATLPTRCARPRSRSRPASRSLRSISPGPLRLPASKACTSCASSSCARGGRPARASGPASRAARRSTAALFSFFRASRRQGRFPRPPSRSSATARGGKAAPARRAGSCVGPGMTLSEARSLCPGLDAQSESPERVRAAAQAAVEAACAVSPRVEETAPGLVHLDASGLSSLFGDERGIARALVASAERVGLCAAVGIAEGKSVALLAARAALADVELEASPNGVRGGAFRVVPREEQAAFLADLPLFALASSARVPGLDLDGDLVETLQRFG